METKEKKNPWIIVLTVLKYAVALALGYISGDGSVINTLL